jgi:tetratricopeptide (TPR) repeat protein
MVFDPYHKWLGIPSSEQPPNHYRLLGISLFESDPDVIDAAANRQMSYIQGFANSEHGALSQRILNELAEARLCLLDTQRKGEYDEALRRKLGQVTGKLDPATQSSDNPRTPRPVSSGKVVATGELDLLMSQAKEAHVQSRWDLVIEATTQVIRNDPKRVGAYLLRAEALRKQNRADRALADLAVAIRLNPQSPHPHVIRAGILKKQGQFDQAIAEVTQAIFLDPNSATAYAIRCECRQLIGDQDGASQDAEELFRLDPTRELTSRPPDIQDSRRMKPEAEEQIRPTLPMRRFGDGGDLYADGQPVSRCWISASPSVPRRSPRRWSMPATIAPRSCQVRCQGIVQAVASDDLPLSLWSCSAPGLA